MSTNSIFISGHEIERVTYRGEPVVTFTMIDKIHERPQGTAKRTFQENRKRFVEGEDFFELCRDEIRTDIGNAIFHKKAPSGFLITRRGYLKITKSLNDDKAWAVLEQMIDAYFIVLEVKQPQPALSEPFSFSEPLNAMAARISFIREARQLFGIPRARQLWAMAGFPVAPEEEQTAPINHTADTADCLTHLLSASLKGHIVLDLIHADDGSSNSPLAKAGIRVLDDGSIAVATAAHMVAPIFARSHWANGNHIMPLLSLYGAARFKIMRFNRSCARTILVPREHLYPQTTTAPAQQTAATA